MTPNAAVLTFSILTIPEREPYLKGLLASIDAMRLDPPPRVDIVYNRPLEGFLGDVIDRIRELAGTLPVEVYFNEIDKMGLPGTPPPAGKPAAAGKKS